MNQVIFKSGERTVARVPFNNDEVWWENGGPPVTLTGIDVRLDVGGLDVVRELKCSALPLKVRPGDTVTLNGPLIVITE